MHTKFQAKIRLTAVPTNLSGSWTQVAVIPDVLPQEAVPSMCIKAYDSDIYITKAQAMEFFGLAELPAILTEAAGIIGGTLSMREPIVDELEGFALMLK